MNREEWIDAACIVAHRWALAQRTALPAMTFEQIRGAVMHQYARRLEEPAECRWWGAVASYMIRQELIRKTPKMAAARSSNYAAKRCYWVVI